MQIDYVHFYVEDALKWCDWFVKTMGMMAIANRSDSHTCTAVLSSGSPDVVFVLSSPLNCQSPVTEYLRRHPPGVVDLAFRVENLELALSRAIAAGAKICQPPRQQEFSGGRLRWCQIAGIGDLNHTLSERSGITPLLPFDWLIRDQLPKPTGAKFTAIDHVVLNVAAGELASTVSWYEAALGFQRQQTFTIGTKRSALYSQVLVHPKSGVQLPINEPVSANSQIQEFLDLNGGSGIQHIALKTDDIAKITQKLRSAGLAFLEVPLTYYEGLQKQFPQLDLLAVEWQEIVSQQILVDYQETVEIVDQPLLLQIFTQPIFTQPTFFFELIERRFQAKGFGERNFRALFEAIENEQLKRSRIDDFFPYS